MNIKDSIVKNSGLILESKVSSKKIIIDLIVKSGATDKDDKESLDALYQEVKDEMKKNPKLSIKQAVDLVC